MAGAPTVTNVPSAGGFERMRFLKGVFVMRFPPVFTVCAYCTGGPAAVRIAE
jgi:hypothetical protein